MAGANTAATTHTAKCVTVGIQFIGMAVFAAGCLTPGLPDGEAVGILMIVRASAWAARFVGTATGTGAEAAAVGLAAAASMDPHTAVTFLNYAELSSPRDIGAALRALLKLSQPFGPPNLLLMFFTGPNQPGKDANELFVNLILIFAELEELLRVEQETLYKRVSAEDAGDAAAVAKQRTHLQALTARRQQVCQDGINAVAKLRNLTGALTTQAAMTHDQVVKIRACIRALHEIGKLGEIFGGGPGTNVKVPDLAVMMLGYAPINQVASMPGSYVLAVEGMKNEAVKMQTDFRDLLDHFQIIFETGKQLAAQCRHPLSDEIHRA